MFRINPFKTSREAKHVPNIVRASARTKPITVSQPPIITKKDVNSDSNGLSSTRIDNTKTRRLQPRSNTKNDRVPSASKSSRSKNKGAEVEEHHRNLLLSKNTKHIYVNGKNSRGKKQKANVSIKQKQKKHQLKVKKPKQVGFIERLATPKPRKPRFLRRWSPTGRLFDQKGKIVDSSESDSQSDCSNGDHACTSNTLEPKIKRFPNSTSLLGRNNLVSGLLKFKYHKEHLCSSCEQGKSKRASHPPIPVPNLRQRLHLLHLDLCGPTRIASINGKRYVLVIVDDYSRYTWVHFLRSKDEAPEAHLQSTTVADNVQNALFDGNTFVNLFSIPSTSAAESSSSHNNFIADVATAAAHNQAAPSPSSQGISLLMLQRRPPTTKLLHRLQAKGITLILDFIADVATAAAHNQAAPPPSSQGYNPYLSQAPSYPAPPAPPGHAPAAGDYSNPSMEAIMGSKS
nr:retrovirus-related Pol polyprotein from transposon TNT 1-94 [Tanacetum cinerariifolium]